MAYFLRIGRMRNLFKSLRSIILLSIFFLSLLMIKCGLLDKAKSARRAPQEASLSAFIGEKISYDIRLGMFKVGNAVFNHLEKTELDGKQVNLMTFQVSLARFNDVEKIYSDYNNFLPLRVERDINVWPTPEKITENYDQNNFTVTITKFKGKNKEEIAIRKDGVIHNSILLPYYVRRMPKLDVGWALLARFPTNEFLIKLVSMEDVTVPAGTFKSYRFESTPKKFEIWISADARRIPVKIKGTGSLGYAFVMREYSL